MKTNQSVPQSWQAIKNWLKNEAADPNLIDDLDDKGITEAQLTQFEQKWQLKLPTDFRESYKICNGEKKYIGFMHGSSFFNLEKIDQFYAQLKQKDSWQASWIPFAENSPDFAYLCQDTKTGHILFVYIQPPTEHNKIADNFQHFLNKLVADLRQGNGVMAEMLGK